jgi:hypothetical protein
VLIGLVCFAAPVRTPEEASDIDSHLRRDARPSANLQRVVNLQWESGQPRKELAYPIVGQPSGVCAAHARMLSKCLHCCCKVPPFWPLVPHMAVLLLQ